MAGRDRTGVPARTHEEALRQRAPARRFRRVLVGAQLVTLGHVRLWMGSVPMYGGPEGSERWWLYVENYDVASKIARELAAGSFYRTVLVGLVEKGKTDHKSLRLIRRAIGAVK